MTLLALHWPVANPDDLAGLTSIWFRDTVCGIMLPRRRVVLDTNVLVAALRSHKGASFLLLSLVGEDHFDVAVSVPLVLEYEEVLVRQLEHLEMEAEDVRDVIDFLCRIGCRQQVFYLWRPLLPDLGDDMILELAVAANCEAIVTFNKRDFAGSERFGIKLYTPREFLDTLGDRS